MIHKQSLVNAGSCYYFQQLLSHIFSLSIIQGAQSTAIIIIIISQKKWNADFFCSNMQKYYFLFNEYDFLMYFYQLSILSFLFPTYAHMSGAYEKTSMSTVLPLEITIGQNSSFTGQLPHVKYFTVCFTYALLWAIPKRLQILSVVYLSCSKGKVSSWHSSLLDIILQNYLFLCMSYVVEIWVVHSPG